jgi:uncharacterized protein YjbI with pentapeptide repeats
MIGTDLSGSCLQGADLQGADLREADLSGVDLRDANLRDAIFGRTRYDTMTVWPAGFSARDIDGLILKGHS